MPLCRRASTPSRLPTDVRDISLEVTAGSTTLRPRASTSTLLEPAKQNVHEQILPLDLRQSGQYNLDGPSEGFISPGLKPAVQESGINEDTGALARTDIEPRHVQGQNENSTMESGVIPEIHRPINHSDTCNKPDEIVEQQISLPTGSSTGLGIPFKDGQNLPEITPITSRSPSPDPVEEVPTATSSPIYASLPLQNPRMIRIFELQKSSDPDDKIIRGQLRIIDLDENPSFTAISYCWGTYESPSDVIYCGDEHLDVTKNAWSALWHLRKKFGPIKIWMDAICINQNDNNEKRVQIPLMSDIYSNAEVVYIWLGSGDKKTDRAMKYIQKGGLPFSFGMKKEEQDNIPSANYMSVRLGFHIFFQLVTWRTKPHNKGLRVIFSRRWINRLWTLQEVLLARKPVLMCGEMTAPWKSLVFTLQLLHMFNSKPPFLQFPSEYSAWWSLWEFRSELYRQRGKADVEQPVDDAYEEISESELERHRLYLQRGWLVFVALLCCSIATVGFTFTCVEPTLINVLEDTKIVGPVQVLLVLLMVFIIVFPLSSVITGIWSQRPRILPLPTQEAIILQIWLRKATEARDRYFGVHGLINKQKNEATMVDLTVGLDRIYRRLFIELLKWTGSLDIMLLTSCSKFNDVPSWVMKWRNTNCSWLFIRYVLTPSRWARWLGSDAKIYEKLKGATPGSESIWKLGKYKRTLIVRGKIIGEVSRTSELLPKSKEWVTDEQLLQSIRSFQLVFDGMDLPKIEELMEQVGCMAPRYSMTDPRSTRKREKWCKNLYRSREKAPEAALEVMKGAKWRMATRSLFKHRCAWDFHGELTNYMAQNERILIRCSGEYSGVGITCGCVKPGDLVALISGVSTPMILRTDEKGYQVLQAAFLGGVMNGELWKGNETESLEELVLV
jgi:hypothetical protein